MDKLSPRTYNLPHDVWRPGQHEAINALVMSDKDVTILSAETGSGKSAIGAGLGSRGRDVRFLTSTKALQNQYGHYPGVEVLFGLNAYECDLMPAFNADSCIHADKMTNCPSASYCHYLLQRAATKSASRQSLSYAYFLSSIWPQKLPTDFLFCDEAHELPNIIMAHMKLNLKSFQLSKLGLPTVPTNIAPIHGLAFTQVYNWLLDVLDVASREMESLEEASFLPDGLRKKKLALYHLTRSVRPVVFGMEIADKEAFLIESDMPGEITISPLTSAPFFNFLFSTQGKKVLASATIGRPSIFAGLLGLSKGRYDFHQVDPAFAPESRPVFYHPDAPSVKHRSPLSAYKKQAELVMDAVRMFPNTAHGLLHFSSKESAKQMADMLSGQLGDKIWMPPETGSTDTKIAAWEERKKRKPGTIAFTYSFHAGVDAPDVTINIVMKVPFIPLDKRGAALLEYNPVYYNWVAATQVEQAVGRNRRGEPDHYEVKGQPLRKFVAVLDNNFLRLKNNYSRTFNLSLSKM